VKKLIEAFYEFRGDLILKLFTDGISADEAVLIRLCNIISEIHDFCNGGWRLFMPTYKRSILENNIELWKGLTGLYESQDLDSEFSKAMDRHFWDLV